MEAMPGSIPVRNETVTPHVFSAICAMLALQATLSNVSGIGPHIVEENLQNLQFPLCVGSRRRFHHARCFTPAEDSDSSFTNLHNFAKSTGAGRWFLKTRLKRRKPDEFIMRPIQLSSSLHLFLSGGRICLPLLLGLRLKLSSISASYWVDITHCLSLHLTYRLSLPHQLSRQIRS
ncbi:hypothetical protein K474DRAFT_71748 [Panus rudis PR-1116 ss-1]|nr:hypothetical protein K474DRAFT_71748 [Panus rudis PR-1116 ss-1]